MGDRARWSDSKSPCIEEANQSYKCLDENNYNRDACQQYFDAYKKCKKEMNAARRQGRPMVKSDTTSQPRTS